jgi:hypothetical protein
MVDAPAVVLCVVAVSIVWSPHWLSLGALGCRGGCFRPEVLLCFAFEAPDFLMVFLGSL